MATEISGGLKRIRVSSMYIRTKDGIYETRENGETYNGFGCKFNNETIKIHKKDILNQSENLEELCDEFVGIDKTCENGHQLLRAIPYKCANFWNGGVYGAIWVDGKGLIYVAKMNDKGDLELI